MIVDTSALVAVVFREPGYERLLDALTSPAANTGIGTPTIAELGLVLSARLGIDARMLVAGLVRSLEIEPVVFSDAHWAAAVEAFWRFGRGRHPARLNFGDCLTYAIASLANEALLFTGDDFTRTDLTPA